MKRLFGLFCVIVSCFSLFGMQVNERVLMYLGSNSGVCFPEECLARKDVIKKLNSSKISDTISCIRVCGTMIGQSLFKQSDSFRKLETVLSLLSDESDKNYTGKSMKFVENVFSRLSGDTDSNCLHKLAFFAPTAANKLPLSDWLSNFSSFVKNGNNYELSKWNQKYDLELALCVMFTPVSLPLIDWSNNKKQYVENMCGAIRTYLYYVENKTIDTRQNQRRPSSSIILEECYDFYSKKIKLGGEPVFKIHQD